MGRALLVLCVLRARRRIRGSGQRQTHAPPPCSSARPPRGTPCKQSTRPKSYTYNIRGCMKEGHPPAPRLCPPPPPGLSAPTARVGAASTCPSALNPLSHVMPNTAMLHQPRPTCPRYKPMHSVAQLCTRAVHPPAPRRRPPPPPCPSAPTARASAAPQRWRAPPPPPPRPPGSTARR